MGDAPTQTAATELPRNQSMHRPYPFQDLVLRIRSFFDPRNARVGFRSAFILVLAALVTAHMPVVVGMGYAPWDLEILFSLTFLGGLSLLASVTLHRLRVLLYLFVCFWIYWALDAYLPEEATLAWVPTAMVLVPIDLTADGWSIFQNVSIAALIWVLLNSRVSDNLRAMLVAFSCVWFVGLWMSSDRELLISTQQTSAPSAARDDLPHGFTRATTTSTSTAFHSSDGRLRPVIHFILDEQMSPRALPETIPEYISHKNNNKTVKPHPANLMVSDYLSRGFVYHSHVRSVSSQTHQSLASLMSLEASIDDNNLDSSQKNGFRHEVKNNSYIKELQDLGYTAIIAQNTYLMTCQSERAMNCLNYTFSKTGAVTPNISINASSRIAVLLTHLQRAYSDRKAYHVFAYSRIEAVLNILNIKQNYDYVYYNNPIAALNIIRALGERLESIKPGEAYIMHILMPHFPYMTDTDCRIKDFSDWSSPNRHLASQGASKSPEKIYADYWDQSACTHARIMSIIDKVREESELTPIIFVHGDHGARITGSYEDLANPNSDSVDMLETFLAVFMTDGSSQNSVVGLENAEHQVLQTLFARTFNDARENRTRETPERQRSLANHP